MRCAFRCIPLPEDNGPDDWSFLFILEDGESSYYPELGFCLPTTILKKVRTTPNQGPGSGSAEIEYFQFVKVFHRELLRLVITDHDTGDTKCARGCRPHVLLPFELRCRRMLRCIQAAVYPFDVAFERKGQLCGHDLKFTICPCHTLRLLKLGMSLILNF